MLIYFLICLVILFSYLFYKRKHNFNLENEHCLVTGGSSGIGLSIAIRAAKAGANITIVARCRERLDEAKKIIELSLKSRNQIVLAVSEDISNASTNLKGLVEKAESICGPISLLVNCAGTSLCSEFENTSDEDFMNMLNVNYLGSVRMTQAVIPSMKLRKSGRIVFVSSLAGVFGLYGYTAYSGSKFAVVGAAEALHMEVKPYNITVTVSLPPDTDTPGFAEEMKNKPIETVRISEKGGLFSAQNVADKTLADAMKGKFLSSVGFEGWLLCTLCSSTTPAVSFLEGLTQILTMGVLRLTFLIYLKQCHATVTNCAAEKEQMTDSNKPPKKCE